MNIWMRWNRRKPEQFECERPGSVPAIFVGRGQGFRSCHLSPSSVMVHMKWTIHVATRVAQWMVHMKWTMTVLWMCEE
jgi:hypothetical protein